MTSKTFSVPNIGCAGCVQAIENELGELDGVQAVNGNMLSKTIQIEYDAPASWDSIVETLREIDYPPAAS